MADGQKDGRLDEGAVGFTSFGGGPRRSTWYTATGRAARWFSKFFATKSQPFVVDEFEEDNPQKKDLPPHPQAGDAVVNADVLTPAGGPTRGGHAGPQMTELEIERRSRYQEYENMDDYPEVAAAFDVYADDSTQATTQGDLWIIDADDDMVRDEVEKLFETIDLEEYYWDIIRNTVKYGDLFTESIVDHNNPKGGIQRIKILNPNYIFRVENEYGYLTDFLQEIPRKNDWGSYGLNSHAMTGREFIVLDRNQITHFRLHTSDPAFYPYGKSVAADARQIFRSLKLMEDAMLIYRLTRAPERRIFYIDVGNLPTSKAESYIESIKQKFKKEKFYDTSRQQIDERYNPLSSDEDFFFPMRKGTDTKVETLPGAQNLGEVDDVKYFRDKLLAILKVPKDFIVEKDKSPERKANLSQLDVKFAKVITRVQRCVALGFTSIAKRHLQIKGFPTKSINRLKVKLPSPSDMFEKRRLDLQEKKAGVVASVLALNLFSKETIYKDYYEMSDKEIEEEKKKVEEDMAKEMENAMMQDPMMGGGGMGMGAGPVVDDSEPQMGAPAPYAPGGVEPQENKPPTTEEILNRVIKKMILEGKEKSKVRSLTKLLIHEKRKSKIRESSHQDSDI